MSVARPNPCGAAKAGQIGLSVPDALTHAEICLLYQESTDTIRFAKTQQWKTLGSTLLLFGAVLVLDHAYPKSATFGHVLMVMSLMICDGAIYALSIYQAWQDTERRKLSVIAGQFSDLAKQVRGMKSRREANVFRYLLLSFLISGVVMGEVIVLMVLTGAA